MTSNSLPHPTDSHHIPDSRRTYLVFSILIAAAWVLLILWQRSSYAELLGHEALGAHPIPPAWHLMAFLLSWFLMTVAMMLPGSLPLLIHSVLPIRPETQPTGLVGLLIVGYLSPWVLFGLAAFSGDSYLHAMMEPAAPLAAYSNFIAPAIVLAAGLYQFTPVKRRMIQSCRPSQAVVLPHNREGVRGASVFKQGLRLGILCIGSCWLLMLLMFALGHQRLDWMFALGAILAAERLAPWGYRLAWLIGFVLIVWAAFWVLFPQF